MGEGQLGSIPRQSPSKNITLVVNSLVEKSSNDAVKIGLTALVLGRIGWTRSSPHTLTDPVIYRSGFDSKRQQWF